MWVTASLISGREHSPWLSCFGINLQRCSQIKHDPFLISLHFFLSPFYQPGSNTFHMAYFEANWLMWSLQVLGGISAYSPGRAPTAAITLSNVAGASWAWGRRREELLGCRKDVLCCPVVFLPFGSSRGSQPLPAPSARGSWAEDGSSGCSAAAGTHLVWNREFGSASLPRGIQAELKCGVWKAWAGKQLCECQSGIERDVGTGRWNTLEKH